MKYFIYLFFAILCINIYSQPIKILNKYYSLSSKDSIKLCLNSDKAAIWWTNNPYFKVSQKGIVNIDSIPPIGMKAATIFVKSIENNSIDSSSITSVDWPAGNSNLIIENILPKYQILGKAKKTIFFAKGNQLFKTYDGFKTTIFVSKLPASPSNTNFLKTHNGYFLRCANKIYFSKDLKHWDLSFSGRYDGLYHSFDHYYDSKNKLEYIFISEYTWDNENDDHKVYRGIMNENGKIEWKTVLTFYSRNTYFTAPQNMPIAYHIHVVKVDPYTGTIWIGTGDYDRESMILYSNDYGETFHRLGIGGQEYRPLAFWFTKNFIYWNMDSGSPQFIYRISRSVFNSEGLCPSLCPTLNTGFTKVGFKYLVINSQDNNFFPVSVGQIYTENKIRSLDDAHIVISLDDKIFDYKEKVANLSCGSMWYVTQAKTAIGEDLTILGISSSANYYDKLIRVFGIKENVNETLNIQELLCLKTAESGDEFGQLEPKLQDIDGYIYFQSRALRDEGVYKTKLEWNDSILKNKKCKECPTEFLEFKKDNNYIVYPNPSNGEFNIYSKFGYEPNLLYWFEVFNLKGELVFSKSVINNNPKMPIPFNLKDFKDGFYLVKVHYGGKIESVGQLFIKTGL